MSTVDFYNMTKKFLLGEGRASKASLGSYIQSVTEIVNSFNPRSKTESRRVEIAKEHLREIRKRSRVLEERVSLLEERLHVLEEGSDKE